MLVPALEIGGTHVTAAVVDLPAGVVRADSRRRDPLGSGGPASVIVRALVDAAAPVVTAAGQESALGVAIPGPFDYARGIGRFDGVAKFGSLAGLDLRAALRDGLDGAAARISFVNDADAFVLGEWVSGAAARHRRVVGITLGTGVGSGFLDDGRLVTDDPRVPPEGSVHLLTIDGQPLEDVISRRALLGRARATIEDFAPDAEVLDLARLARSGDPRAGKIFDEALAALGIAIAPWLAAFEASVLVVGGSMAGSWSLLERPLVAALQRDPALADLMVRPAAHPEDSALVGAAVHAWQPIAGEEASRIGDRDHHRR